MSSTEDQPVAASDPERQPDLALDSVDAPIDPRPAEEQIEPASTQRRRRLRLTRRLGLNLLLLLLCAAQISLLIYVGLSGQRVESAADRLPTRVAYRNPHLSESAADFTHRALMRQRRGDLPGALSDLTQAIALDPGYADAYYYRAGLRDDQGDHPGMDADLKQAQLLDPHPAKRSYHEARRVYRLSQRQALDLLRDARLAWPQDAEVAYMEGLVHLRNGSPPLAIVSFARATELDPNHSDAYYQLGQIYQNYPEMGGPQQAYLAYAAGSRGLPRHRSRHADLCGGSHCGA